MKPTTNRRRPHGSEATGSHGGSFLYADGRTVGLTGLSMQILALAEPPHNLLIYHARLKPGCHTAYDEIEQDIARDCAELGFPLPGD